MNETEFWSIVEASRSAARGSPDAQERELAKRLEKLAPDDIVRFDRIYRDVVVRAYVWDLWGAAYLVNGGCSDDGFDYFRDWLVSKGRAVYEAALRDADTLADVITDDDVEQACEFESLRYVASDVWRKRTGEDDFPYEDGAEQPAEPSGSPWNEDMDELTRRFPRLAARFG